MQCILHGALAGLLNEACDAAVGVDLHDAEGAGFAPPDGNSRDTDVGVGFGMLSDNVTEIHSVQLVPTKNQQMVPVVVSEMNDVLADGVRGALVPGSV